MKNRFDYNPPNTRARVAARRKTRTQDDGSLVVPGPRRKLGAWVATGRLASLLLLLGALGGLLYIATAPRFVVQEVRVEGTHIMRPTDIVALADVRGASIWLVDRQQVVERLKRSPYVERAAVEVMLPDRVTITIEERRPEVRWRSAGTLYLVAADGRVLGAETTPLTDALVIDDRSARPIEPDERIDPDALTLASALALRLPNELGMTPANIAWGADTGILVTTDDGRTIIFGRNEALDNKLVILNTLLKDGTAFTYLDLRPSTPFYRNDPGGTPPPVKPTPIP